MPHFRVIDEDALGPEEGPLLRARLHIRGGKKRLREGMISEGLITLSDALSSAMQWYVASSERRRRLNIKKSDDLNDDKTLFGILTDSGVLDGSFDYEAFDRLIEEALAHKIHGYDYSRILRDFESLMTMLGVMPFDEESLPPHVPEPFLGGGERHGDGGGAA